MLTNLYISTKMTKRSSQMQQSSSHGASFQNFVNLRELPKCHNSESYFRVRSSGFQFVRFLPHAEDFLTKMHHAFALGLAVLRRSGVISPPADGVRATRLTEGSVVPGIALHDDAQAAPTRDALENRLRHAVLLAIRPRHSHDGIGVRASFAHRRRFLHHRLAMVVVVGVMVVTTLIVKLREIRCLEAVVAHGLRNRRGALLPGGSRRVRGGRCRSPVELARILPCVVAALARLQWPFHGR